VCAVTLTLLLSAMLAYVLARFDFPGNRVITSLSSGECSFRCFWRWCVVPIVKNLGMINTYQG